jgi:hypothetical protein
MNNPTKDPNATPREVAEHLRGILRRTDGKPLRFATTDYAVGIYDDEHGKFVGIAAKTIMPNIPWVVDIRGIPTVDKNWQELAA